MVQRIQLDKALEVQTKTGHVYRLEPAGDGISIHAVAVVATKAAEPSRGGGRPPSPETLALRERMEADAQKGGLQPTGVYLAWFQSNNPGLSDGAARQRVQNERNRVLEEHPSAALRQSGNAAKKPRAPRKASGGRPGPKPKASTLAMRERLEKDAADGGLRETDHYVAWLLKQDPGIADAAAKARVYKEMRPLRAGKPKAKKRKARGRGASSPALEPLREKLRQDHELGQVEESWRYAKYAQTHDKTLGLKRAKQLVAREKRALKS